MDCHSSIFVPSVSKIHANLPLGSESSRLRIATPFHFGRAMNASHDAAEVADLLLVPSARGDCNGDAIVLAGATGRVGAATLTALVREGTRVVVISRDLERAGGSGQEPLNS